MPEPVKDPKGALEVQKSFDRLAGRLDLRLEPAPGSGEVRHIGAFFAFSNTKDVATLASPPPIGGADDAAIAAVVRGAASLLPDQVLDRWQEYYNDPTDIVGRNFLTRMDQKGILKWAKSAKVARLLREYPPFSPRKSQVTDLRIVYIGDVRAAVNYHLEEQFQNGKVAAGNASALLVKIESGWRILVVTSDVLVDTGE